MFFFKTLWEETFIQLMIACPFIAMFIIKICIKKSTYGCVYSIIHLSYAKIMLCLNIGVGFTHYVQKMCLGWELAKCLLIPLPKLTKNMVQNSFSNHLYIMCPPL